MLHSRQMSLDYNSYTQRTLTIWWIIVWTQQTVCGVENSFFTASIQ